jgi:hypothetical protein
VPTSLTGSRFILVERNIRFALSRNDHISYSSRKPHRLWNYTNEKVRTLWFNLQPD